MVTIALLMTMSLLLRLHGLHAESVWWDEYASLAFLNAPSLAAFLEQNRTLDPATLPLYFVLEYCWAHWVSGTVYGLRLLGVGIGVAAVPLVYALGARLYGRRAGYVAALLLTLSPIHIHHSQSIRMYGLLALLGVASFWSLLRLLQRGKRSGWWLHGGAALLLYWTHPFALLAGVAQGCWLLLHRRLYRRALPGWFLMHAMLSLPVVGYVLSIRFWPQDTTSAWLRAPGVGTLLADLFFDDIIAFHWQLRLGDISVKMGALRALGDAAFALVILGCLVGWTVTLLRRRDPALKTNLSLLFCWLITPPLALFIISHLWRPCMFPRYTAHCAVAMYLLLGGMAQQMRHREWRLCAYGMLGGLMLFQWLATQPGPQRTNWQAAARFIHARAKASDVVLVDNPLWRDVFAYNVENVARVGIEAPMAAAADTTLLAAQSALFLGKAGGLEENASHISETEDVVWAVVATDYFETSPPRDFELELMERRLEFDGHRFPAIRNVYVYRIRAGDNAQPPKRLVEAYNRGCEPPETLFSGYMEHHAMQAFAELAEALARQGRKKASLDILNELFQESPFAENVYGNLARAIAEDADTGKISASIRALWDGYGYRENQRFERASRAFAQALKLNPNNGIAALELGMELAALKQYPAAADAFERAAALDAENAELVDNLVAAIRTGRNVARAYEAMLSCRDALIAFSRGETNEAERLFQHALSNDPQLPRAQVMLGFIYFLRENYAQSFVLFSEYLAHGRYHSPIAYTHLALMHILRDEPDQALALAQKAMELDEAFKQRMEPLINALLVEKDYARVIKEMERLEDSGIRIPPRFKEYVHKMNKSPEQPTVPVPE